MLSSLNDILNTHWEFKVLDFAHFSYRPLVSSCESLSDSVSSSTSLALRLYSVSFF